MDAQYRHMIAERPGIGATGHITQATRLNFTSLTTTVPMIICVRRGRKVMRSPGAVFELEAGEAIAVAQGHVFDFENIPAEDGDYEARWLTIEPAVVAAFAEPGKEMALGLAGDAPVARAVQPARLLGRMGPGLSAAFETAVLALQDDGELPDAVVRHRVGELLAWLGAFGARFSLALPDSWAARIRRLAGPQPGRDWTGPEVAARLGVSEATLRRRLQEEGSGLRDVLTDIRMMHALQLLQSSTLPVSAIAASAGFESQSRFAIRFRSRFGFPPTAVRGKRKTVTRMAAE
jgi:AraC-like DNA-binding protein